MAEGIVAAIEGMMPVSYGLHLLFIYMNRLAVSQGHPNLKGATKVLADDD